MFYSPSVLTVTFVYTLALLDVFKFSTLFEAGLQLISFAMHSRCD